MLYMLGSVEIDTSPFPIEEMERDADASIVAKPIIGGRPSKEFTGEGEDDIILSGEILPYHVGGLDQLETLHEMRRQGARFPIQRGDGWRPGWYSITRIRESHRELSGEGVGYVIKQETSLTRVEPDAGEGQQLLIGLINLFSALVAR